MTFVRENVVMCKVQWDITSGILLMALKSDYLSDIWTCQEISQVLGLNKF